MSDMLAKLKPPRGSRKGFKRVGRGPGSGLGKTCGRGQKGQTSRSGRAKGIRPGFEGGQMPLQRRLPKRGFINPFRKELSIINVRDLNRFDAGATIGPEDLLAQRLIQTDVNGVKLLAVGEIEQAVTVRVHACSAAAKRKVEAVGGTVELLGHGGQPATSTQEAE